MDRHRRITELISEYQRMRKIASAALHIAKFKSLRQKFRESFPTYNSPT
jgi:hypothetical protein